MTDPLKRIAEDLKSDEGWVPYAYQDHLGYWTIGYGFLIDRSRGGAIPERVADFWLNYKLDSARERLSAALPWFDDAPEQVQRALVNMAYQLGLSGLLRFRKTLSHLAAGEYAEAADEALRSRWAEQTPNRARRVAGWIRSVSAPETG